MHIYKCNETVSLRMWACLRKSWHWHTQTLKIDYTALSLVFYTKQHMCNTAKMKIFWFSFTIIRKHYQSVCRRYYHTFLFHSSFINVLRKKGKTKLKLSFLKSTILTGTHRILLKLNHSDAGWKEYEEFMLLNNLNSDSQNCGQHCEPELNLLEVLIFDVLIVKRIFICKYIQNTIFNISGWSVGTKTNESSTFFLWQWNCKLIYQVVNCTGGSRSSQCGLTLKSHHWQQLSLPGICCLSWDFPEVQTLLTVSNALTAWQKVSMKSIKQSHKNYFHNFRIHANLFPRTSLRARQAAPTEGSQSVRERSLVHQWWD